MYEAAWNERRTDEGLNLPEWDSVGCVVKCAFVAADIAKHIEGVRAMIKGFRSSRSNPRPLTL